MYSKQSNAPYFLGCPIWSCHEWIGRIFSSDTNAKDLLKKYSIHFNTVEGNSFFYGLPTMANIERWMAETPEGFQFAPKFPKCITHERRLSGAEEETRAFLKILDALAHGNRLGPSYLQLPPSFNINLFDTLKSYIEQFPTEFALAIEPRHISWYDKSDNEERLNELLASRDADKVIFDSRPLFSAESPDHEEADAQSRKPQTQIRKVAIGRRPFLRFVGRNDLDQNEPWIREWAPVVNKWILEKKMPYVFIHAADDTFAPELAQRFHQQMKKLNPLLPDLPEFEGSFSSLSDAEQSEQLDLF